MAKIQLIALALISSLCVLFPLSSAVSTKFDYCNKHLDYDVKVSELEINPYPVRSGKPATFSITASTGYELGLPPIPLFWPGADLKLEKSKQYQLLVEKNEKQRFSILPCNDGFVDDLIIPVSFRVDKPIVGGELEIDVYVFGIRLHSETHDICSETTGCPISAGNFKISHSQELPEFTPAGNYKLKMRMKDEKNEQLTCISFSFRIQWGDDAVAES